MKHVSAMAIASILLTGPVTFARDHDEHGRERWEHRERYEHHEEHPRYHRASWERCYPTLFGVICRPHYEYRRW